MNFTFIGSSVIVSFFAIFQQYVFGLMMEKEKAETCCQYMTMLLFMCIFYVLCFVLYRLRSIIAITRQALLGLQAKDC
jgi:hypothetical protein